MSLRDDVEQTLRTWNGHEIEKGAPAVIDFDCHPAPDFDITRTDRLAVHEALARHLQEARAQGDPALAERVEASLTYLDALLGSRLPMSQYVRLTQGCEAAGWTTDYVASVGEAARRHLAAMDVPWGSTTDKALAQVEEPIPTAEAPDVIREAASELENSVRALVASDAPFKLSIEHVNLDAYWSYWLDGVGSQVRMRINLRKATFTRVQARQFALHEILGHGLQCASFSQQCATTNVPWVRLTAVHAQQQVLLEGLAQALPLFVTPNDQRIVARVRLAHYIELVRSELHIAVNRGVGISECVEHARKRVPFWSNDQIADSLSDRSTNPLLRSYLWAYPAGIDWFCNLADKAPAPTRDAVLHAAYREPLTPTDLKALWPSGPPIGGTNGQD